METNQKTGKEIHVIVNSKATILTENMTILELLENRNAKNRSAVWVNGKQLLQAEYPIIKICEGDLIKILRVVAGG